MNSESAETIPPAPPPPAWPRRLWLAVSLRALRWLFRLIATAPDWLARRLAWLLSVAELMPVRGWQAVNLARLFPELDAAGVRALRRRHLRYLARLRVHVTQLRYRPAGELRELVELRGAEHLRAALERGRGVLLLGAHAGTWWHAPTRLALDGLRVTSVMNPALAPPLVEFMRTISGRFGVALAFVNQDAYGVARGCFQRNEVFYIAIDRTLRPERSLRLPVGGLVLPVDPGPAILALRQRPAVLWASCHHGPDGRSVVELSPEIAIGPGTPLSTAGALAAELTRRLEHDVVRWPEQWWSLSFCSPTLTGRLPSPPAGRAGLPEP